MPSRIDKADLIICTPAVLVLLFGSHVLGALLIGLFFAMVAVGRFIYKMLPKPARPQGSIPAALRDQKPIFHLVAHARMSRFQWDAMLTIDKRPEALWAEIKRIYRLDDRYVKFTAEGWMDHINWNGQYQQAGSRIDGDSAGDVFLYFYTLSDVSEPAQAPADFKLLPDDKRWALQFQMTPGAVWLDPYLWQHPQDYGMGYLPGEAAMAMITEVVDAYENVITFQGYS